MDEDQTAEIAAAILELTAARAPKTICPSDVARALAPSETAWRALMPKVRAVAARLANEGALSVTQRGAPVDAERARGPIRLAAPAPPSS